MLLPRARAPWRVTGKPLHADIEVRLGEIVIAAKYARDAEGRSQLVYLTGEGVELFALEIDPVRKKITHRDKQRTQSDDLGPDTGPSSETQWGYAEAIPEITQQIKEIEKLRCKKVRYRSTDTHEPIGESWVAFDHGLVLLDQNERGEAFWRVSQLELK